MNAEAATLLLRRARREPTATVHRARALLAGAAPADEVRLRHAIALASVENGELAAAATELAGAMRLARSSAVADQLAELTLSAAWVELERGNLDAARALLHTVHPVLRGGELAKARCLGGLLHYAAGECATALGELDEAIRLLRRSGDRHWLANALVARAAAATYLARFVAADADFDRAARYFLALGEVDRAACCVHNRGFVELRRGDLPAALRRYDEADRAGLVLDRHPELLVDRAETLLAAGLSGDARAALDRAAGLLGTAQRGTKIADLMLAAAECALRAGDPAAARDAADRARRLLVTQRRTALLPAARAVLLRARLAEGAPVADREVRRVAAECDRHGWQVVAAELRLAAASSLEIVARQRFASTGQLRVLGWLATARLAESAGEHAAVRAAAEAGLRIAERHTAAAGALEPRSAAAATAAELAALGLTAALRGGHARCVFRWIDRHRTVALRAPELHPPNDPALAAALSNLRDNELAARGSTGDRLAAAERAVRRAVLASRAGSRGPEATRLDELPTALGDAAMLSWTVHDGALHVVSVVDGRWQLHRGADVTEVDRLVESLRFATTPVETGLRPITAALSRQSAQRLDELLFSALAKTVGDRPLVLVPVGSLHGLPWAKLPSCRGRAVSVVPSARAWLHAHRQRTRQAQRKLWVAGPELAHAEPEVRALHTEHGGELLTGKDCTVAGVLNTMDGAEQAHIAAHGQFRADAPMFSGLRLVDGQLYGHDLDRLCRAPRLLVLSACDSARQGEQLLGLGTVLLRKGSAAIIASLLPVPDEQAGALLTAVHANLRAGLSPAHALARAQTEHDDLGFICLGAG